MSADPFCTLIQEYGYILLFLVLLTGIVGLPIPDEGILLFTGVLIARNRMELVPSIIIAILAVQSGSLLNYWIAACLGRRKIDWKNNKWKRAFEVISKYGIFAVPLSYFVPGLRLCMSYGAGLLQVPIFVYMISSLLGVLSWVSLYLWLGCQAGLRF